MSDSSQRKLAVKLVEMYITSLCSIEEFNSVFENTEPDVYLEFIDVLVDATEKIILIESNHEEGNGNNIYLGG